MTIKRGRPPKNPPESATVHFTLRLTQRAYEKLKLISDKSGIETAAIARRVIERICDEMLEDLTTQGGHRFAKFFFDAQFLGEHLQPQTPKKPAIW